MFLTDPVMQIEDPVLQIKTGGRSWWNFKENGPDGRPSLAYKYNGWETSLQSLKASLIEHQPIDGLLGFSQVGQCDSSGMLL